MSQYEMNVNVVMKFLVDMKFCNSVICCHRKCYKELQDFLLVGNQYYSWESGNDWLESHKSLWKDWRYRSYKLYLMQLNDVYNSGKISLEHLGPRGSVYKLLKDDLRIELDEYLVKKIAVKDVSRHRIACSRFLYYLQEHGLTSIMQLDYGILFDYHKNDYHKSVKSKAVYENLIRMFLRYQYEKKRCSFGFSLALSQLIIPHIVRCDFSFYENEKYKEYVVSWTRIECFINEVIKIGYSSTIIKAAKHYLKLLFIFLDMHQFNLTHELLWMWFDHLKPLLGTGWKQARRTLYQFESYLETDKLSTQYTGDPYQANPIDSLPFALKSPLQNYLGLSEREGLKDSTISMRKSSNLRFLMFLKTKGLEDFSEITPKLLEEFNINDLHTSTEGKAAYNVRIRNFLKYLFEEGKIYNPLLYKALPSVSAPSTKIIRTLSENELNIIETIDTNKLSSIAFRDYVIVSIGLTLGFRASDIVSIQFKDINWKIPSIGFSQTKTGKLICVPLSIKLGNLIYQYLTNHRPKSKSSYIFIHHEIPYDMLNPDVCRKALKRYLPNRELVNGDGGFHIVRKTFATQLLKKGTKVEVISDALGHSTNDTVLEYLALDETCMRKCPLSLEETGILLKGGVFNA